MDGPPPKKSFGGRALLIAFLCVLCASAVDAFHLVEAIFIYCLDF